MPGTGSCTVVVGCQWGDEGKGKIVDVLAEDADIIARYQGGANAGHTVHVGPDEFILHQIPSGILHAGKRCLLGNGVVLDVEQFFHEYDALAARGIDLDGRVGVSRRAHVLLPYHRFLDRASESAAEEKIGTTGRGIGPAYEDKAGRRGVRVADFVGDPERRARRVGAGMDRVCARLDALGHGAGDELKRQMDAALALDERLRTLATDTGPEIARALAAGTARPSRRGAGHRARPRPRHLSLRHLVEHHGVRRGDRDGHRSHPHRRRDRRGEGLHDPGRRRTAPHGVRARDGRDRPSARRRVRRHDRPPAPLRVVRLRPVAIRGAGQRPHGRRGHQARRARYAIRGAGRDGVSPSGRKRGRGLPGRHLVAVRVAARLRDTSGVGAAHRARPARWPTSRPTHAATSTVSRSLRVRRCVG